LICCAAKCVWGGTPVGILVTVIVLNLPLALLACFNVIKFDFNDGVDFLQIDSRGYSIGLHVLLFTTVILQLVANVLVFKAALTDPGILPSRLWPLEKFLMPSRYTSEN
jgi:hypothetical protein